MLLESLHYDIRSCVRCPLVGQVVRGISVTPVPGIGPRGPRYMFIGRNPGFLENKYGEPFWPWAPAGERFEQVLLDLGETRGSCYITNLVKCHTRGDAVPSRDAIGTCASTWLEEEMAGVEPSIVVAIGNEAKMWLRASTEIVDWPFIATGMTHPSAANRRSMFNARLVRETKLLKRLGDLLERNPRALEARRGTYCDL